MRVDRQRQLAKRVTARVLVVFVFLLFSPNSADAGIVQTFKDCRALFLRLYAKTEGTRNIFYFTIGQGQTGISHEAYLIFEKSRKEKDYNPTDEEKALLEKEGVAKFYTQFNALPSWIKHANHWVSLFNRGQAPAARMHGWKRIFETWRFLTRWLPIPDIRQGQVDHIYGKVLKDPTYQLTEREKKRLTRFRLENDIERFRKDLALHQNAYRWIYRFEKARVFSKWGVIAPMMLAAIIDVWNSNYISVDDSLSKDKELGMNDDDGKVEIIFSGLAQPRVRIGGEVFEFSTNGLKVLTLTEFKNEAWQREPILREHLRLTMRLSEAEKSQLLADLKAKEGEVFAVSVVKKNANKEIMNALSDSTHTFIPPVVDRSQRLSILYFKLRDLLGTERIEKITYATSDENKARAKTRDGVMAAVEAFQGVRAPGSQAIVSPIIDQTLDRVGEMDLIPGFTPNKATKRRTRTDPEPPSANPDGL